MNVRHLLRRMKKEKAKQTDESHRIFFFDFVTAGAYKSDQALRDHIKAKVTEHTGDFYRTVAIPRIELSNEHNDKLLE